ncbi:MAG TPA: HEAT repeat domain-containing protein [Bryobacteraceae bacterium]|nr:HEAT repeat domain-containing protein [Bryobacteraceae bacterium]
MPCDADLLHSYVKDISALVESFNEEDTTGKQSLTQLMASDAQAFCGAGIRVLGNTKPSEGARFLMYLLAREKLLTAGLLDESTCSLKDAIAAARVIDQMGSRLQPAFEMALSRTLQLRTTQDNAAHLMRILDILGAIPAQNSWPSFQNELMSHPDKGVRSKAALLVGRGLKNRAWISRRMMDKDARVQANAVEALWTMDAAEARPVFLAALHSPNNRVVANAALGLYRLADLKSIKALLDMAQHADPLFHTSCLWAIGETEDPRFIPFLMEQFKTSQGKKKLAVTKALSRIRRREKSNAEKGTVQICVLSAKLKPDGSRTVEVFLSWPADDETTAVKPTEFALWEGGRLIDNYEVKLPNNPAVLVNGIVAPRFLSDSDSYGIAVAEGLKQCLALKRPDDWWRIDRYAIEAMVADPDAPVQKSTLPYDNVLVTQDLKTRKGFLTDLTLLEKAISLPVPNDRTTADALEAIRRQIDAMDKSSGKRHLFVFVHATAVDALDDPEYLKPLKQLVAKEGVSLHGICPDSPEKCTGFRDLCLFTPAGTFHGSSVDKLAEEFEATYERLLNRYEIKYSLAGKPEPAPVILQVCCEYGVGRAEFSVT